LQEFYRLEPAAAVRAPRVSEGVTMHQGCNRSCTFCIVPSTRGRERSRTPADLESEIQDLVSRGTHEVVLLSQIAERYGRDLLPGLGIQTDIIVGFPGETDAQFDNTLSLLAEIEFDIVHVAAYSPRPGTPAADWPDQLPLEIKKRRLHQIEELQKTILTARN